MKLIVARRAAVKPLADTEVPDVLVSDDAVRRYLDIEPPSAAVIPEFQVILDEIEDAYVSGLFFAALSAACVSIERILNLARIELHRYHPKVKELWSKGPSNAWDANIEALRSWGYLPEDFAAELNALYREVRNRYLHSGEIQDVESDALRAVRDAYRLVRTFLGFPEDLFGFEAGAFKCLNPEDPRYKAFYLPRLINDLAMGAR